MFGAQNLLIFVASGILLALTPGQDTFYILSRVFAQGRRAGLLLVPRHRVQLRHVHPVAAALGLSAILAASARAFLIARLAGAAC